MAIAIGLTRGDFASVRLKKRRTEVSIDRARRNFQVPTTCLGSNGRSASREFDARICRSDGTRRATLPLVKVDYFGRSMSYREVVVRTFPVDTSRRRRVDRKRFVRGETIARNCTTHRRMISRDISLCNPLAIRHVSRLCVLSRRQIVRQLAILIFTTVTLTNLNSTFLRDSACGERIDLIYTVKK